MTIDEAIKWLEGYITGEECTLVDEGVEAIQLGIKALELLQGCALELCPRSLYLYPGETEE